MNSGQPERVQHTTNLIVDSNAGEVAARHVLSQGAQLIGCTLVEGQRDAVKVQAIPCEFVHSDLRQKIGANDRLNLALDRVFQSLPQADSDAEPVLEPELTMPPRNVLSQMQADRAMRRAQNSALIRIERELIQSVREQISGETDRLAQSSNESQPEVRLIGADEEPLSVLEQVELFQQHVSLAGETVIRTAVRELRGGVRDYDAAQELNWSAEATINRFNLIREHVSFPSELKARADKTANDLHQALVLFNQTSAMESRPLRGTMKAWGEFKKCMSTFRRFNQETRSPTTAENLDRRLVDVERSVNAFQQTVDRVSSRYLAYAQPV